MWLKWNGVHIETAQHCLVNKDLITSRSLPFFLVHVGILASSSDIFILMIFKRVCISAHKKQDVRSKCLSGRHTMNE
jgi:hypothetical protein